MDKIFELMLDDCKRIERFKDEFGFFPYIISYEIIDISYDKIKFIFNIVREEHRKNKNYVYNLYPLKGFYLSLDYATVEFSKKANNKYCFKIDICETDDFEKYEKSYLEKKKIMDSVKIEKDSRDKRKRRI